MLTLVLGANGSGKSVFAERMAAALSDTRVYLATMRPVGAAGAARVAKHRAQRAGLGFETRELPDSVANVELPSDAAVLLEDVSNLLANRLFERSGSPEDVLQEILALKRRCRALVLVSISGLNDAAYSGETGAYIRALNALNDCLAACADTVVELKNGRPTVRKGTLDESLIHRNPHI